MDVGSFASQALECLPIPFLALESVCDPSGTEDLCVRWANPVAQDRFGSDLEGRWLDRDDPLGTTEAIVAEFGPARSRVGLRVVERQVERDGRTEHLRCTLVPVGEGAAMMVEDVTAEMYARADLASAGTRLARVEQWGNLGVWEYDLLERSTYWSTQVFQILGIDEAGPDPFRAVVHPDDLPMVNHVIRRALDQPGPYRLTHRIVRHGDVRTLDQHLQSVAGPDGRPVRLIGTMIDVTAVHALQDQVRQIESMRALGELAGGLAHDFNNVLMIVRGHADLLLHQIDAEHGWRPNLEAISRAGERATTLTRKLMAVGRQDELRPASIAPATILGEAAGLLDPAVGPDVKLELDLAAGADRPQLYADADHLNQLLIDLVLNARDAGASTIRLRYATEDLASGDPRLGPDPLPPGRYGVVQVVDDGEGIDQKTLQRIFEPFFTTKESSSGSGLGLANALNFARQSMGTLVVDSEPGTGTTMSLLLPIDVARAVVEPPRRRRANQTRVLIAAADGDRRQRLVQALSTVGPQLVSVDSIDAMAYSLASEPIDVVVADTALLPAAAAPVERLPTVLVSDRVEAGAGSGQYRWVTYDDEDGLREAVNALLPLT